MFDDTSLLALQYAFIPSVHCRRLKVSLVEVVFLGNRSKAELFWVIFLLQNLYVSTNVAVTPTEACKQLLPHRLQGRNSTAPAEDVLLKWEKACRIPGRQTGDVPSSRVTQKNLQMDNQALQGYAIGSFWPLQGSCCHTERMQEASSIFLELCLSHYCKRYFLQERAWHLKSKNNGNLEVKTYLLLHKRLIHLQLFLRNCHLTFLKDDAPYPLAHVTLEEWLDETARWV